MQNLLTETNVDFDYALEYPPFNLFLEAWNSARPGEDIPNRLDIKIQNFSKHVTNMVITERVSRDKFWPRLTGGAVDNRMSGRLKNLNLLDLHTDDIRDGIQTMLNALLDTPCGVTTEYSIAYPNGKHVGCQLLLLPVRGPEGTTMVLSIQRALGTIRLALPTEMPLVGQDYALGRYWDLGFGLPENLDQSFTLKAKDPSVFDNQPTRKT